MFEAICMAVIAYFALVFLICVGRAIASCIGAVMNMFEPPARTYDQHMREMMKFPRHLRTMEMDAEIEEYLRDRWI
ncbi:MAG: hypothetical protein DRQ48_00900 [Gammaproteobacteria bacterium]|nr:MAG: hypothetical protein DRQ44_00470 [Gammaproteobacteria bacterium]RKZ72237.1 MAG: hypothetical protein DRQ48_00900 [Gammaproteobacteria bacterium]